mgnify:CR=1 FL=1
MQMKELITGLLEAIGEDPSRDGLVRTPERVARSYEYLTSGYRTNVADVINGALFAVDYNEMVIVRDIDFYSLCEHHMLPFFGKCHVAYIPNGRVIGLSKIPRRAAATQSPAGAISTRCPPCPAPGCRTWSAASGT